MSQSQIETRRKFAKGEATPEVLAAIFSQFAEGTRFKFRVYFNGELMELIAIQEIENSEV